ncbi:AraC family transcriptional regulator [Variovorax paradoxus]|uniref:AraC family transcriptional regulator n=1 Tax=Variovorax paradoxus TaxID=34073 RepID=UPI0021ABEBEF|nr:AraC family transcriptional regulator [Variovorax paradoxus]UVH60610.1 AraC family transcriptional regulator [Variovorax paradoxus]
MSFWDYTRSPASARLMMEFGQERGHPAIKLLEGSKLSVERLEDPQAEIHAAQELRVASNLLRLLKRPRWLGFEVGKRYGTQMYGYLGCGFLSSATICDSIKLALRFAALTFAFYEISFHEEDGLAVFSFGEANVHDVLKQFLLERCMAAVAALIGELARGDMSLARFTLKVQPQWRGKCELDVPDLFGVKPQLGSLSNSLAFDRALVNRPTPQANPVTVSMCEQMCIQLMERRRVRLGTKAIIEQCLNLAAEGAPPDLASVARLTDTSERTLKRRLKEEGTSFRTLLMDSRRTTAEQLLEDRLLTMTEIAERLGFSSLSSFSQAFKRWFGVAPSEYRETCFK